MRRLLILILIFNVRTYLCFATEYNPGFGLKNANEVPVVEEPIQKAKPSQPTEVSATRIPQSTTIQSIPQGSYEDYAAYCARNGWKFNPSIKIGCIKD